MLLRALFNGLLQEQLSHQGQRLPELGSLLKQVNQLFRQANLPGQFPLLVGYYHSGLKNLILVSAGLNASLNTGEHHIEVSNGVPLGTLGTAYLNQISHRCSSGSAKFGAPGTAALNVVHGISNWILILRLLYLCFTGSATIAAQFHAYLS